MDRETEAAVARIAEKNQGTVGWMSCAVGTFFALTHVVKDWNKWGLYGKFAAGCFVAVLVTVYAVLIVQLKKRKPISVAYV
jgi:hypothetical protein